MILAPVAAGKSIRNVVVPNMLVDHSEKLVELREKIYHLKDYL